MTPHREAAEPSFETPMNITIPNPKAYYETLNTANMHFRLAAIPAMERPETAPPESGRGEGWPSCAASTALRIRSLGFNRKDLPFLGFLVMVPKYSFWKR